MTITAPESEHLRAGVSALDRGDWPGAVSAFDAALREAETPDALDGLGQAHWWLNHLDTAIELRTRAYAAYVEAGRPAPAVTVASWLAREYFTVHGNLPAASGWISRADSLLESAGPCPEAGWLALIKSAMTTDTDAMKSLAQQAIDLGRSFRDHDLEIVGVSALGLARVYATELASGMAALDEAMAAASGGELRSFFALSDVYCNTLIACERAADFERAEQWCRVVTEFCKRYDAKPLFPFCHVTYGTILSSTGRWPEAEDALLRAVHMFSEGHRALGVIALARLAACACVRAASKRRRVSSRGWRRTGWRCAPRCGFGWRRARPRWRRACCVGGSSRWARRHCSRCRCWRYWWRCSSPSATSIPRARRRTT